MLTLLLSTLELQQDKSKTREILQPMAIPPVHQELDYTWICSLNKTLPHLWRGSAKTTSTSVKHDNALVQTSIWDLGISPIFLLFTAAILKLIRAAVLRYCKRKLCRGFIAHLKHTHPSSWARYVATQGYNTRGGRKRKGSVEVSENTL